MYIIHILLTDTSVPLINIKCRYLPQELRVPQVGYLCSILRNTFSVNQNIYRTNIKLKINKFTLYDNDLLLSIFIKNIDLQKILQFKFKFMQYLLIARFYHLIISHIVFINLAPKYHRNQHGAKK